MSERGEAALELERPADEIVRERALARLEAARRGLADAEAERTEGVHDFRVALRRLRSLLEGFGEGVEPGLRRRALRRLRSIGQATGLARDAQAQRAWIRAQLGGRSRALRAAREALFRTLEGRQRTGLAQLRSRAAPEFFALWSELSDAWRAHVAGGAARGGDDESFGRLSARQLEAAVLQLERHLAAVHSLADEASAHRARVAAKRLRYTLELVRDAVPAAADALTRLRALQDLLGEFNDLRTLRPLVRSALESAALARAQARLAALEARDGDEPPAPAAAECTAPAPREAERRAALIEAGCLAAAHRIELRRQELFAQLARDWLESRAEHFFGALHELAPALLGGAAPHSEIEHKYLLEKLPPLPGASETLEIEQGYWGEGAVRERLRRVRDAGGERYYRTLKFGRGLRRLEFEQAIEREEFESLWPRTAGSRLSKRRHRVIEPGGTWEIDEFTDRPLVLAEIELADPAAAPALPSWLEPVLLREVTDDPRYTNQRLADADTAV